MLLLRDNAAPDEAVRERLDDLRPLQLAARVAIVIGALGATATLGQSFMSAPVWLSIVAFAAAHESQTAFVRGASDLRQLERRLLAAVLMMICWCAVAWEVAELPLPLSLLPLLLVLAACSLMVSGRSLLVVLVAGATTAAVEIARGGGIAALLDPEVVGAWEFAAARTVAFAGLALLAFVNGRRQSTARTATKQLLAELRRTEANLADSLEHLRGINDSLADAAEREALLNHVTDKLHNSPGAQGLARALRGAVPVLRAHELAIVHTPHGSRSAAVIARVHGADTARATTDEAGDPLGTILLAAHALVADRIHPLVRGAGGEAPLTPAIVAGGIEALMIAPMRDGRTQHGALVVAAAPDVIWTPAEVEIAERLATALASRLQSDALFEMQERRIRELAGLHEISTVVQSNVDVDRLLSGFTRALRKVSPFSALYVARFDPEGTLLPVAQFDPDGRALDIPPAPAAARAEAAQHAWFSLREATVWPPERGPAPSFYAEADRAPVVVPLRPKGQMLGVIVITPTGTVDGGQLALLGQAIGEVALALDSLSLYRQATVRAARIQVLGNLARIVGSVLDLREEFEAFADEVRWLLPYERAMILRIDAEPGTARPYVSHPYNADLLSYTEPLDTSLARIPHALSQPVVLTRDDPRTDGCDWSLFPDATEVAMVPIITGDRCTAVFAVAHSDTRLYGTEELAAMEEIARLLAVSIERVELFQRAEHNATHDLLTGLANYRGLQERIIDVRQGISEPGTTTVLMVDMDDLKVINDTLGHAVGDDVVRAVARAMREACRADDFVARVGGDEFVIVMEGVDTEAGVLVAERIHNALRDTPIAIGGVQRSARVSVGVAAAPRDAETMSDLLQVADAAMYEAKALGGGCTAVADAIARARETHALRGRPDRLVETIVRAASAGATMEEREAIALAQRYVLATGIQIGLPAPESEVLRMLVARHAGPRLVEPRPSLDRALAFIALDGLAVEWATRAGESAAVAQILIAAATDLAWLQMPAPSGAGCSLEEAIQRLGARRDGLLDSVLLRELSAVARADIEPGGERRSVAA